MSEPKPCHGWEWSCRLLLDGQYQLVLFVPQAAWLNREGNTYWLNRYFPSNKLGMLRDTLRDMYRDMREHLE